MQDRDHDAGILARLLQGVILGVAAALAFRRLGDFDTWWHLAAGRWIIENGSIPHHDTLSYTVPDHAWTNLQWFFDVVIYLLHQLGGTTLLVWFCAAGFTTAVYVMMRSVRVYVGPLLAAVLTGSVLVVVQERFVLRPELLTFLYLAALLHILLGRTRNNAARMWVCVPLMLAWVNSHSLFILGAFCIVTTMAATLLGSAPLLPEAWRRSSAMTDAGRRRVFLWGAAALAVTLVNPYFIKGVLFPFELLSRIDGSHTAFASIGEFARPFSDFFPTMAIGGYQAFLLTGCALLVLAALLSAAPGLLRRRDEGFDRFDLAGVGIFLAMAYISVQARRNTGVFVVAAAPIVAQWLAIVIARIPNLRGRFGAGIENAASAVVAAAGVAMIVWTATNGFYRWDNRTVEFGSGVLEVNFPVHAADFAREHELPGKLYNDMTSGGYLTWARPIEGGVFVDGRLEVYDAEFFGTYQDGLGNPTLWYKQAEQWGFGTAILFHRWGNRRALLRTLARDPAWAMVYYDETAAVFVRVAGNEEVARRATATFEQVRPRTLARLKQHDSPWQTPLGDAHGALAYAQLLKDFGLFAEAAESYQVALDHGVARSVEVGVRTWLARYLVSRNERASALLQVNAALELDPENELLLNARRDLGGA